MLDAVLATVFWLCIGAVAYSYVFYPLLLGALARLAKPARSAPAAASAAADLPRVACLVAAYNEEQHIQARIANLLAQDYPADRLRVYVGSDGSSDRTAEIIERLGSDRVRTFAFERNRGKASVVNDLVAAADEPILVLTDANTEFAPDAVRRMVARFDDARVGAVCGELRLLGSAGNNQDSLYWRVEQFLKRNEARLGGLLGANGAIYALRRELYASLRPDTITDDFCIAMTVAARRRRLVYEPLAIATEDTPDDMGDEYHRRVRIGIGNYQAMFRHPEYLFRSGWVTGFTYLSHKVLRWITPHLLIVALVASLLLSPGHPAYAVLTALQIAGYALGMFLYLRRDSARQNRPARVLTYFLVLNWAFCVASWRYATGNYRGSWRRTARSSSSA
jgi:cellulose synthase/poly-beta-1,6-N-acetylglucosamine synthase-like glycosyltransferase